MQGRLVAVGAGCEHGGHGFDACVGGRHVQVPCCGESVSVNHSCTYRPGFVSGILCCQQQSGTTSTAHHFRCTRIGYTVFTRATLC